MSPAATIRFRTIVSLAALLLVAGCGDDDDGTPAPPCEDRDGDGYAAVACGGDDCDDANILIHLDAGERCDGLDNDCDLVIDDGNFGGIGPDRVADVPGATEVTWGAAGTGSFRASNRTTAFRFRSDGTLASASVAARTNPEASYGNVASSAAPVNGCLSRALEYVAPDPSRAGGGVCTTDADCIARECTLRTDEDGGVVPGTGRCATELDGGLTSVCFSNAECSEVCASGRCVPYARPDVRPFATCDLRDFAVAPVGTLGGFAVGVTTQGCVAGTLRAGWFDENDGTVSMYGPEARSNLWLGVDVGDFPGVPGGAGERIACSGASRGTPGASRPALAALRTDEAPQALVAYLGAPFGTPGAMTTRPRCAAPASSVPVEVLGLVKETGGPGSMLTDWVMGSNGGRPERLGDTAGLGAPAVTNLAELGWLVAYPEATASGGTPIALHFLPPMTPPAPYTVIGPDGRTAPAHVRRPTLPLAPAEAFVTIPADGRADFVALALGADRDGLRDVGVAWMEDCSEIEVSGAFTPSESVWFALVRVDPARPNLATASIPVRLSTDGVAGGQPTIAYAGASNALVAPGWARAGGTPVADDRRGGFVVAWAGAGDDEPNDALYAVRVAEADGLPVDDAPRVLPVVEPGVEVPAIGTVSAYASDDPAGGVSFGAIDARDSLVGGRLVCPLAF
jgi:hypothetical protein